MGIWPAVVCAVALACPPGYAQSAAPAPSGTSSASTSKSAKDSKIPSKAISQSSSKATGKPSPPHTAAHTSGSQHSKSTTASAHKSKSTRASLRKGSKKKVARGQQKIDTERAQAIQEALIREHYLSGEATGTWNQASEDAMRRYQAEHGWQSKTVPDARALISLGLGPSHDHLLNPESAMTTGPGEPHSANLTPVSHSADPGAQVSAGPSPASGPIPAASANRDAAHPQ
jgi:hypothetical protein